MDNKYRHPQFSTKGLVAHYKLWAGLTTTTTVFDYSFGGFTGTVTGAGALVAYPGFSFEGAGNFIDISAAGPTSVQTVLMWVNPDSIAGNNGLTVLNATDTLGIAADTLTAGGFASGTLYVDGVAGDTVTANWHLVGVTVPAGKNANSLFLASNAVWAMTGLIGETMLYNRALSSDEIKSVYELTKWRYPNYS